MNASPTGAGNLPLAVVTGGARGIGAAAVRKFAAAGHCAAILDVNQDRGEALAFPEQELLPHLDNTWTDTAKAVFNNWLGLVYRLTGFERGVPLMPGVDPDDPLGLRGA